MHRRTPIFLLALLYVCSACAIDIDNALAFVKRQSVQLSTGGSTSGSDVVSSTTSADTSSDTPPPSSATVASTTPATSQSTSQAGVSTITSSISIEKSTTTEVFTSAGVTTSEVITTPVQTATVIVQQSVSTGSETRAVVTEYTTTHNGQTVTAISTGSTVIPVTSTAKSTSTAAAGTISGGSSKSSSGLSSSSKAIIGGVVGGVGGALFLGGIAYVIWRMYGRKKHDDEDDIYDPNAHDKMSMGTSSTANADTNNPFQKTLDQYHNPGPVNTASNF